MAAGFLGAGVKDHEVVDYLQKTILSADLIQLAQQRIVAGLEVGIGFELRHPDADQVARDVVAPGQPVKGLASEIFLSNLSLELNTVGSVLGHGFHPLKAQHSRSIPNVQPVHPQGRTPDQQQSVNLTMPLQVLACLSDNAHPVDHSHLTEADASCSSMQPATKVPLRQK